MASAIRLAHVLRGSLLALAAFGAGLVYLGFQLRYYTRTGPGPGFFPVWVGGLLALSSLLLIVQSYFAPPADEPFFPSADAAFRVLVVIASLPLAWLGLRYLGFRITIFIYVLLVPRILGHLPLVVTLVLALAASLGVGYVFEHYLGVFLPTPAFESLDRLGL